MNKLFLLLCLVLISACREEVSKWDELSQDEQSYLRERARIRCIDDSNLGYSNFKKISEDSFSSAAYARGKGFLNKFMQGESEVSNTDIRVWKQDSSTNTLYFYVTKTNSDGSNDNYFLRTNLVQNDEMIDDLQTDQCAKTYDSSIGSSGPLSVVYEYSSSIVSGSNDFTDTYRLTFSEPVFMAGFHLTRKMVTRDSDGDETATKNYSSTFTTKTYESDFSSTDYTNTTYYSQKFCDLDYEVGSTYRFSQSEIGFKKTCVTTLPAGWDLTI